MKVYAFLLLLCFTEKDHIYHESVNAVVVSVYDGDSLFVTIADWPSVAGERIGVRLYGIDTPEMKDKNPTLRAKAVEARDFVRKLLDKQGKDVILVNVRRDKYFRLLADVQVKGESISKMLLEQKLAKEYYGGTKEHKEEPIK